jgi:hypothetical protein
MSDLIPIGCEAVTTMKDAEKPVVTPLLPVKGLRHDENGDLTADAMKTIVDGLLSLGIDSESEDAQNAILMETRQALCNLNAQYQFLLSTFFMSIRSNEPLSAKIIELIRDKNMAMRDILSVSRQILEKVPANKDGKKLVEGWTNVVAESNTKKTALEGFTAIQKQLVADENLLKANNYDTLKRENFTSTINVDERRAFEISEERTKSVSANLALYSFLNVIAVGLLFYIVSTN